MGFHSYDFVINQDILSVAHFIGCVAYLFSVKSQDICSPGEIYESSTLLAIDFKTMSSNII